MVVLDESVIVQFRQVTVMELDDDALGVIDAGRASVAWLSRDDCPASNVGACQALGELRERDRSFLRVEVVKHLPAYRVFEYVDRLLSGQVFERAKEERRVGRRFLVSVSVHICGGPALSRKF
ncbi:hypothetical protein BRD15_13165 [Halobacteriales archaeon SW_6_65_15]|nr:MAG: hypothetical protein BRD15_13165 [Halobacteriales archaeon SW_6_65_15]